MASRAPLSSTVPSFCQHFAPIQGRGALQEIPVAGPTIQSHHQTAGTDEDRVEYRFLLDDKSPLVHRDYDYVDSNWSKVKMVIWLGLSVAGGWAAYYKLPDLFPRLLQ
jgi:hypothetical protein